MPLSEHEQRMLDEIESALYAEDPKFATTVRKSSNTGPTRVDVKVIAVAVLGAVVLVAGLAVPFRPADFPVVSLVGFVLMFVAGVMFLRGKDKGGVAAESGSGQSTTVEAGDTGATGNPKSAGPKWSPGSGGGRGSKNGPSYTERMEERFRKRFGEGEQF